MAGILGSAENQIKAVIKQLIQDPILRRDIVYYRWKGEEFDEAEGVMEAAYDEFSFMAARTSHSIESARLMGAGIEAGDVMYVFQASDCPAEIGLKDYIEDGAESFRPVKISTLFSFGSILTCKGI